MLHVTRLVRILNVAAQYRLQDFLQDRPGTFWVQLALAPFSLLHLSGAHKRLSKNQRLRKALEELGPIYIKFGQLLSTRRDFLDTDLADELEALQGNVPPFLTPSIETLVEQALGKPVSAVFESLDPQALASASVAQVHKATLLGGDEVVVKVLRPGIEKTVKADLGLLKTLARALQSSSSMGRRLRPVEVVRDYEKVILGELNLQAEAANTSQLRQNFENSPQLYVPKVYWDFTRPDLLVMERIHGVPVTDIPALEASNIDLRALAENGVNIFFKQVFDHNFFHADMHPGNIFVAADNPEAARYIAIDCAIMGSLTRDDQEYLAKNLLAIFKRDYRRVAELHVECGWVPQGTQVHEFESAIRTVCEPIFEKPLKEISFAQLLVQLFRTAARFNMEVQPSLVLLQKTLLNIEGLGRQLYPELDLWQTALPNLERWNSRRLSPLGVLGKLQENLPDWLDRLPDLPVMVINAINQAGELQSINANLQQNLQLQQQQERHRKLSSRVGGIVCLLLAALLMLPGLNLMPSGPGLFAAGFATLGIWLLCLRR